MSLKWTGTHSQSETGILRKSEFKEKKEELFVFGYSCKLFRDDAKALHIDQGKHLIPWMGDDTLKIDRYDARGALHDLGIHEAPQGGFDWRVELTRTEQEVEQLCDEERYRALHTDEEEELMYKEEELKRLHKAGYGQVGFNYDTPAEPSPTQPAEVDEEPFVPAPLFKELMPVDIVFPETMKQNVIIDKTAMFIANQGAQMEILIKAKQRDNTQFKFLNKDDPLHPYYTALTALVKAGKWPPKQPEVEETHHPENEEYLHPSLATPIIESAPSIPSIQYKPSADCDYTMLVSKMRGDGELAPGELPPPGTEPAPAAGAVIARPPILYNTAAPAPAPVAATPAPAQVYQHYPLYYQQTVPPAPASATAPAVLSTGLSLMKSYDSGDEPTDSEEESPTNGETLPVIPEPPVDVKAVIEKMAAYVARNGDEFADIVRAKNDPRFTFLEPTNVYYAYYSRLMREKRGVDANGSAEKKNKAPVSFSIKKMKEPDPILPKPALPYESSSDEEEDAEKTDNPEKQTKIDKSEKKPEKEITPTSTMPPVLVYKMDGQFANSLPKVKTIEPLKFVVHQAPAESKTLEITEKKADQQRTPDIKTEVEVIQFNVQNLREPVVNTEKEKIKEPEKSKVEPVKKEEEIKETETRTERNDRREIDRDSPRRERKRPKEEYRAKSESRDYKRSKSVEREKRRVKEREEREKRKKAEKVDMESEIISLEDNSDDMIDLTGDQSDSKGEAETETDKTKQLERRKRAAEFLKKVGVDPAGAASLPTNSLASAMVDTLESIRKKKAAEEEKRRRKEKRRRRERRDYNDEAERSHRKSKRRKKGSSDEDDISTSEGHKKKKRKKDKKSSKSKKKRRHSSPFQEEEEHHPLNIDLTSTLKELRTNSPTKNLIIPDVDTRVDSESERSESGKEDYREEYDYSDQKKERRKREYSEGEWSSDTEQDSVSDGSKRDQEK